MTITQRVKNVIMEILTDSVPSPSITVVDAKQRATPILPFIAVEVAGVSNYSDELPQVQRVSMDIVLSVHAGDEDDNDVENWIAEIESTLQQANDVSSQNADGVIIYSWIYSGSRQEWDDSILQVNFSVECLATRA